MIVLTRGIGESFLNLTSSKAGAPVDSLEPETIAFQSKVLNDGGKILDINKLDNFIKANKAIGKYNALQFAVSKQFGYKLDGSGNIIKIYDASKNGNDLDISRGEVPEDLSNDMFFLNNVFFKDETVTFDVIGDKFTFVTDIEKLQPDDAIIKYMIGFGDLWFQNGGTSPTLGGLAYVLNPQRAVVIGSMDVGVKRVVDFRHNKGVVNLIRKDGVIQLPITGDGNILNETFSKPDKIVYGGRTTETAIYDADCYLNDSFFYNDYLTDQQLEAINNI